MTIPVLVCLDPETPDPDGRGNRLVPIEDTIIVELPKRFYDDHVDRELIAGMVVHESARTYDVRVDRIVFEELVSDATYYANPAIAADMGLIGLASSARATLKRLRAIETPW